MKNYTQTDLLALSQAELFSLLRNTIYRNDQASSYAIVAILENKETQPVKIEVEVVESLKEYKANEEIKAMQKKERENMKTRIYCYLKVRNAFVNGMNKFSLPNFTVPVKKLARDMNIRENVLVSLLKEMKKEGLADSVAAHGHYAII